MKKVILMFLVASNVCLFGEEASLQCMFNKAVKLNNEKQMKESLVVINDLVELYIQKVVNEEIDILEDSTMYDALQLQRSIFRDYPDLNTYNETCDKEDMDMSKEKERSRCCRNCRHCRTFNEKED